MSDQEQPIDWEKKIKNKAKSWLNKGKGSLMKFNNRSLWNKLLVMAAIHYILRFFLSGEEEVTE